VEIAGKPPVYKRICVKTSFRKLITASEFRAASEGASAPLFAVAESGGDLAGGFLDEVC